MNCAELLKVLNDYVDGDIDPALCGEFEKHMAGCNPCKVVIDNIRKTITLYKDESVYELPGDLHAKLHKVLREKWKEQRRGAGR